MKYAGKVVGREIKDYGKGKDAEAKEVHFATVRIDGRTGLPSGRYRFALTDEEVENHEFQIGRIVNGSLGEAQTEMNLNGRAVDQREKGRKVRAAASAT